MNLCLHHAGSCLVFALSSVLLSGCKNSAGDEGLNLGGFCDTVGGGTAQISSTTTGCSAQLMQNLGAALDGDYSSFALLQGPGGCGAARTIVSATPQAGVVFPAGRSAGALLRVPTSVAFVGTSMEMRVTTYLDGAARNSAVAVATSDAMGRPLVAPGPHESRVSGDNVVDGYFGIDTTGPYDSVELEFQVSGDGNNNDVRIYEVCTRGEGS